MKAPARTAGPDARTLLALFPSAGDIRDYEIIPPDDVPEPAHTLLVHPHHMTVTVEAHHGERVNVRILSVKQVGDFYARKILLETETSKKIVQFGIVRVDLRACAPEVRAEIVAGKKPFGRILIEHNVLRRIEPTAFLRVEPGPGMMKWFSLDAPRTTYGRLAYIHCDEQPAVELLEIVVPE